MTKTYFVCGNLNHDGREFKPGDTIELVDLAAKGLLEIGIISTDEQDTPAPVQEAPEEEKPESHEVANVGGIVTTTGEPSIDATDDTAVRVEAKDVTPIVDHTPAPVQEARKRARKSTPAPENDPSANL